jgi:hypothetical protein
MLTPKKLAANRANAKKSTGPRTPQGKRSSSLNAISHGITARTLALTTESQDELRRHMQGYLELTRPSNQIEMDLVAMLISTSWRLRRAWRHENAINDSQMAADQAALDSQYGDLDNDTRAALAFKALSDNSTTAANLDRYETRLSRQFRMALTQLMRIRQGSLETSIPQNEPTQLTVSTEPRA